jgi:xanthine dehydrogenase molybdopterin-binding subunit B
MLKITFKTIRTFAIALGGLSLLVYSLPISAQTNTNEVNITQTNTDKINTEDWNISSNTEWNFSSEDESVSVKDRLKQFGEYNSSQPDSRDVELLQENQRWGNQGDVEDYSLETDIYNY